MKKIGKRLGLLICFFWGVVVMAQVQFVTTASKTKLAVNERFRLDFQIDKQGADNFKLPNLSAFRVLQGPSQSISQSWINGRTSYSLTYSYILEPKSKGVYTIMPASISFDGKTVYSNKLTIEVLKASEMPKNSNDPAYVASKNVQLLISVSNPNPYVGEATYVEYRLYVKDVGISNFRVNDLGNYEGFWVHDFNDKQPIRKKGMLGGLTYDYFVLKRAILIPQKSGALLVNPMDVNLTVSIPTGRGDWWGNMIMQEVDEHYRSERKTIKVKELPNTGKPANFSGAVGDFRLSVTNHKKVLKANESALFTLKLIGKGNMNLFELPKLVTPKELEIYEPFRKDSLNYYLEGVGGWITDKYTVVPQYKGKFKIPGLSFNYFNPKDKKYYEIRTQDEFVEVLAGKSLQTTKESHEIDYTKEPFKYIHTQTSLVNIHESLFYKSGWFYAFIVGSLLLIPIGWWLAKKQKANQNDRNRVYTRSADKLTRKYLVSAKKSISDKKLFYEALEKALINYLKAKLNVKNAQIHKEGIVEKLLERQVPSELISQFLAVMERCEMARYAPVTSENRQLDFDEARILITLLDKNL